MRFASVLLVGFLLIGCTNHNISAPPLMAAHRIVEPPLQIPPPFGENQNPNFHLISGNNPALTSAYQQYQRTGVAKTISTDEFIQFPYDVGSQPIIDARVLELTVISLENGEQVSSVSSGDPLRWSYSLVYSGAGNEHQAHIMIKPAKPNISTDFFITTDRRAYLLKLVATENGKYVREVRFWYPQKLDNLILNPPINEMATLPNINVSQLNFNYQINLAKGKPGWAPQRAFDDGVHTYIQLPASSSSQDLPALFIVNNGSEEMVNYRFKSPYFIVDKIFTQAILISGIGHNQQRVDIRHA